MKDTNKEKEKQIRFVGYNPSAVGAKGVAGEEAAHRGYSYKTSQALLQNIIAKKDQQLSLSFDNEEIDLSKSAPYFTDKKGKRVNPTPKQMKLITALAEVIDTQLDRKEVQDYIKELPYKYWERVGNDGNPLPNAIRLVINIPLLAKTYYKKKNTPVKIGGNQIKSIREELIGLSDLRWEWKVETPQGTLTLNTPIIYYGKSVKLESKGTIKRNEIELIFDDIFVYGINDKYSLAPITLLELWNEAGIYSELGCMLVLLLQSVRGIKVKQAANAVNKRRRELKKEKKLSPDEINQELARLERSELTYKEGVLSLLDRVESKRYWIFNKKNKKKYIHTTNLRIDLNQAVKGLLQMGMIIDYFETKGAAGDTICNFVLNKNWLEEQREINKGDQGLIE